MGFGYIEYGDRVIHRQKGHDDQDVTDGYIRIDFKGPQGSGKSTLMRAIVNSILPDAKRIVGPDGFDAHALAVATTPEMLAKVREQQTKRWGDLDCLTGMIVDWAHERNLVAGSTSQAQTVKLFEEGGEVAHAVARGDRDALKDGIGDMIVVLTILAAQNGLTVEECVAAAYDEIKDRKGRMVDGIFVRDV